MKPPENCGDANAYQQFHPPDQSIRDYFRVLITRKWIVLGIWLLVLALAGLYAYTRTPIYRSLARLQIAPNQSNVTTFQQMYDQGGYSVSSKNEFLETQTRLILEDRIAEQTFQHFGIGEMPNYRGRKDALNAFKSRFAVAPVRRTWLVEVTFDWPDAAMGAQILSYHVQKFVEDFKRQHEEKSNFNLAALRRQCDEYLPKLEKSRQNLQSFKEQYNMLSFDKPHDTVAEDLMARSKAVAEARQNLAEVRSRLEQIESAVEKRSLAENLPDVLKSQLIRDYRNQKALCEQDLNEGLKRFGQNHPEIRALRAKLESIDDNINLEIQRILASMRNESSSAEQLLAVRTRELEDQEHTVQEFNKLKQQYDVLFEEFTRNNDIYTTIAKRIDEIELMKPTDLKDDTITIERYPRCETTPAKPRRAVMMAIACFFGFILGAGMAFLLDNLDTSIKTKEDVGRYLGVNLLGYIPDIPALRGSGSKHSHRNLLMLEDPHAPSSESFRSIRTALSFSMAAQEVKVIMCTSSSPSEGKTLTCANIAAAMAQAGSRVLLVDADMRKPAMHKLLEVELSPGLTNLLACEGASTVEDIIRHTEIPNLDFISAGPIPPNPAELMGCERMKRLFAQISERYDRIIVDTPPVINVTDAAVLCDTAHGVVFVIRGFKTQRELARRAIEILASSGGKVLGVVLNNADAPHGAYYYDSYYYYQQYYYYNEDGTSRKKSRREKKPEKATA